MAIDTVTILDGLTHAQNTADTATLFDIDSATASVVGTYAIHVPLSASQARVIFNNNYDPDGMENTVRVRLTKTTGMTTTGITKTENTEALAWTTLPGNVTDGTDMKETGTIDVSGSRSSTLHIDCCISEAGAHTGVEIIVQVASEASVDDAWTTLTKFHGPVGTAISAVLPGNEAAAQTEIGITNPVANNFDNDGKFKFMRNDTTANCEIVFQTLHGADA